MATVEMTIDNYTDLIESNDIVIVDFWASWCGPCQSFAPVFEEASEQNEAIIFAKVDTEAQNELAAQFQIRSIPTLAMFREQIMIFSQAGALPASSLAQLLEQAKGLDMEKVRADIAAEQEEQNG